MRHFLKLTTIFAFVAALTTLSGIAYAANIGRATYGLYTETYEGIAFDIENSTDNLAGSNAEGGFIGLWGVADFVDDANAPVEGSYAKRAWVVGGNGGWWIQFGYNPNGNPSNMKRPTNMTAYAGGNIDFWVKTNTDMVVKIEWTTAAGAAGAAEKRIGADLGIPIDGSWHQVSTPIASFSGINLSSVTVPAGFHNVWDVAFGTYTIDNVVWKKSTEGSVSVALKNRIDNLTTSQMTWSGIVPGTTQWACADQYIEITTDYHYPGWGIQIYTDNTNATASPRYTGTGNPVGLVDASTTTQVLPMCWRVVDVSTNTLGIQQTADYHLYSPQLGTGYNCWLFMMDKGTSGYADGSDDVTVWDIRGIHSSESGFTGAMSPNYVYIGANFATALTPRTYHTNKLTVEVFYE